MAVKWNTRRSKQKTDEQREQEWDAANEWAAKSIKALEQKERELRDKEAKALKLIRRA